jgi:hypothetical protein
MNDLDDENMKKALPDIYKRYQKMLKSSQDFESLSDIERQSLLQSQKMGGFLEMEYWHDNLMAYAQGDTMAGDRLYRGIQRMGAELKRDENGIPYIEWEDGDIVSATPENVKKIRQMAAGQIREELSARKSISYSATRNSPVGRFVRRNALEIMRFNGGSASDALQAIHEATKDATDEEQAWAMINQASRDYRDSDLPTGDRLACLQTLIMPRPSLVSGSVDLQGNPIMRPSVLQSLGYEVNGDIDPDNIEKTTFTKHGKDGLFTFAQVMKDAEDNDTLGKRLEYSLGMSQMQAVMESKAAARKPNAPKAEKTKERKGGDWFGEGGEDAGDASPQVSENEKNELYRIFGSDSIVRIPPEKYRDIINAQREALAMVAAEGLVVQGEDGVFKLKDGITQEEVNRIANVERSVFEERGFKELARKGQLGQFKKLFDSRRKKAEADKAVEKSEKRGKDFSETKKKLSDAALMAGEFGTLGDAEALNSLLGGLSRRKKAKAEEDEKKAKQRLGMEK